jgi:hypothetical protein
MQAIHLLSSEVLSAVIVYRDVSWDVTNTIDLNFRDPFNGENCVADTPAIFSISQQFDDIMETKDSFLCHRIPEFRDA